MKEDEDDSLKTTLFVLGLFVFAANKNKRAKKTEDDNTQRKKNKKRKQTKREREREAAARTQRAWMILGALCSMQEMKITGSAACLGSWRAWR